jgi:hypothetical protein
MQTVSTELGNDYSVCLCFGSSAVGVTETQPWRTIQKAADTAQAGDAHIVFLGIYNDSIAMEKIITSKKILFLMVLCLLMVLKLSEVSAAILPPEHSINWQPGLPEAIPDYPVSKNVRDFGAMGDGNTNDTQAIQTAINAAPDGTAVLVPEGVYLITASIQIQSSVVLRGEGHQKTTLRLSGGSGTGIRISGGGSERWVDVLSGSKGSYSVEISNASGFSVGDFVLIKQDNDPALFQWGYEGYESYGDRAMGQILRVSQISGNTLTFERPLYLTYKSSLNPKITPRRMVERAGVEDLKLERVDTSGWGRNINLSGAAYSWVRRVWSERTLTAHVQLTEAYGNEIRGNYFNDSYLHSSGGQGYGIRVQNQATDNLIEDNIFNHLRHSMVVTLGATGNVFGYNYSRNPYTSQSPDWLSSDITIHGTYAYLNLFEGNTVQRITIDNVHGTNGPTTLFRNRIEKNLDDIEANISDPDQFGYIEVKENNPNHNIVGNELGIAGSYATKPIELDSSIADTIIVHGNYTYQTGSIEWDPDIADHNLPASYYLTSKPAFFGSLPWPLIGGDLSPNTNKIPAQQRYVDGTYIPSAVVPTPTPSSTPTPLPTATPVPPTPTNTPTPVAPTPTPNPNELIIDNTDAGFSTNFSEDVWQEYARIGGQHYGDSHYYNRQTSTGQDTATWSFTVPRPGTYNVYAWWWEGSWRPTDVPYTVNHLGGSTTVRVSQQTNGGQWNLLGTFDFQEQGSVVVSDDVSSGQDVVADAVRLVYLGPLPIIKGIFFLLLRLLGINLVFCRPQRVAA